MLGLLGGVAFGTWAGSQVFLVVPAAVSALLVVARRGTEAARRLVVVQSICWGTTALFALLFGIGNVFRGREAFASHFPSLFQPLVAAVVAIGFPVLLRLVAPLGARPARSVSLRLAVALSPLLLLAAPAVRGGLSAGLGFLVRSDPWFRTIAEFHPLLASRDTRIYGEIHLGWAMYLLPVGAIVLARRSLARPGFDGRALLGAAWFAHVTALSLLQIRFVFYAAPALAALAGWGVSEAFRRGRGRGLVAAAATALLLWPAIDYWRISIRSAVYPRIDDGLQNLLVHLRNVSPPAGDWYDPDRPPAYSVFADWDLGHWVLGIAERPVVANNFGIHVDPEAWRETARFYGAVKDEGEALSILGAHRSRYLLTKLDLSAPAAGGKWTDLFARRLHLAGGSEDEGLAGSGHFRLVSEAPPMARIGTGPAMRRVGTWRLFEVVAGAKLVCWAAPGTAVEAETRAGSGPEAPRYRRRAVAAPDGRAELLLGWPGRYSLRVGGETTELTVPVEAVRSGAEIRLEEPAGRGPS